MHCSRCKTPHPGGASYCVVCGAPIAARPPAAAPAAPLPQAAAAHSPQYAPQYVPQSVAPPAAALAPPHSARPAVRHHMGLAIVSLFFSLLFGAVAFLKAESVGEKLLACDMDGARRASQSAKKWSIVGIALGTLQNIALLIALSAAGVMPG